MSIFFYSDGAAECVTGSKHYLEIDGQTYQIDCGMIQGEEAANTMNREWQSPVSTDRLSGVFLTHAHADHSCLLPKLVKDGYKGKIWSTPATRDLASIIMLDSSKIQKYEKPGPAYEESHVIDTIDQFRCHFYKKYKRINDDIAFTFYDAGHILGSSMIDFEIKQTRLFGLLKKEAMHILFTGDLGRDSNPITHNPATDMPAPHYIIMESTYGNRLHEPIGNAYLDLMKVINTTIEKGGKVIIPSFAVERAQELIYYIKTLMQDKKIPRVPVYVDSPMASNATGVFNIHPECLNQEISEKFLSKGKNPFSVSSLRFITDYGDSITVAKSKKPAIIISASGMCEAGRILNHLKYGINNNKNTIIFVGYQAENTLGRKILDGNKKVAIDRKEYTVNAEIAQIQAFSSHADYNEMLEWLNKVDTSKLKKIYLVHGDKDAQAHLKNFLEDKGFTVEIVKKSEQYKLI